MPVLLLAGLLQCRVMKLLRHRSEQVAAHLREQIQNGELAEPLPGTRVWSQRLGVSPPTLASALHQLQREGWLMVGRRGVRLVAGAVARPAGTPTVRILHYGAEYPEVRAAFDWIIPLSERLHLDGIRLSLQRCSAAQLRAIAKQPAPRKELFVLSSLPARYQTLFAEQQQPAIVFGQPAAGLSLPSIQMDQNGAVAHAVRTLVQHGHRRLVLALPQTTAPGLQTTAEVFDTACASASPQPIHRRSVRIPMAQGRAEAAARRLPALVRERLGIIVIGPVPPSLLMTALLERGIAVPARVELIAVGPPPDAIRVCPRPAHYPFPIQRIVKTIGDAAAHFFATGEVPRLRKVFDVEFIPCST